MAINAQTFSLSWTPTNALQPTRQSPATLPTYSDSNPTQVAEQELTLAAGSPITLALPPGWSQVTQALLINVDSTNYINLKFGSSNLAIVLAPNGGHFDFTASFVSGAAVPLLGGQSAFPAYGTWVAEGVTSSGVAASSTVSLYAWLAGF